MKRLYYSYSEFIKDVKLLANNIAKYNPDALISVARGGMTITHFLAQALDIRNVYSINSIHYENETKLDFIKIFNIPEKLPKKVVIIDDIADSGETLQEITGILKERFKGTEFKTAVVFCKEKAIFKPDFCVKNAECWIDFFWESDLKKQNSPIALSI